MRLNFSYIEEKARNLLIENDCYEPGFDIKKLAKNLNIKVHEEILGDDVAGFFVMTDRQPVVTINKKNIPTRRRFSTAHEIGHFILHAKEQPFFIDKTPRVMFRNSASATGEDLKEREANAFAAALLMPKDLLEDAILDAPHDIADAIKALADDFKVSQNAMSFRLSNLGYGI